ncbi:hypothetical protein OsI_15907 [Oryza sativa Indica Group]|uniref:Uncharacterized protein n=1 Tax=Oryza sativa subsp. indica TaxID=39946 RepID=B8ATR6_ORYSI|nr:hypothetical protein OsI_15907 [Oryza sativa Indica Group]
MAGTPVGDGRKHPALAARPSRAGAHPPGLRETASGMANEGDDDIRAAEKGAEEDGGGGPPPGGDGDQGPWNGASTGGCRGAAADGSRHRLLRRGFNDVMAIVVVNFFVSTPLCRHQRPGGSLLTRIAQMLVVSARKWGVEVPADRSRLHESSIKGNHKLEHTKQFACLDRAAVETPEDMTSSSSAWRPCVSLRCSVAMPASPSSLPLPCFRSPPPPFRPHGPPRRTRPLPPMNWIDPLATGRTFEG